MGTTFYARMTLYYSVYLAVLLKHHVIFLDSRLPFGFSHRALSDSFVKTLVPSTAARQPEAHFAPRFLFLPWLRATLLAEQMMKVVGPRGSKRLRGKARQEEMQNDDLYQVSFKWQVFDLMILIVAEWRLLSTGRSQLPLQGRNSIVEKLWHTLIKIWLKLPFPLPFEIWFFPPKQYYNSQRTVV